MCQNHRIPKHWGEYVVDPMRPRLPWEFPCGTRCVSAQEKMSSQLIFLNACQSLNVNAMTTKQFLIKNFFCWKCLAECECARKAKGKRRSQFWTSTLVLSQSATCKEEKSKLKLKTSRDQMGEIQIIFVISLHKKKVWLDLSPAQNVQFFTMNKFNDEDEDQWW